MLGLSFTDAQIEKEKRAIAHIKQMEKAKAAKRKAKKQADSKAGVVGLDQDDNFFFIAGYTSGGAPYGITWTEMGLKPYEDGFTENDSEKNES